MSKEKNSIPLISFENVGKIYQTPAGVFRVLSNVSLEVALNSFTIITGASGSGKSTLLHLATGLDEPSDGLIRFSGQPISYQAAPSARWRAGNIGIVFQFFQLLPTLRAIENVMLPMEFAHDRATSYRSLSQMRSRAMELLDLVGLADYAEKLPQTLSGGEQQRVAIARALANDPPFIVADEPTGNLDSANAEKVIELLRSLKGSGKTILMATHDQATAERADQEYVLKDGRLV